MRAVAEFVMRGRTQAIGVAVAGAVIPFLNWLSIAAVSLVVLRKGMAEGAQVMLWASLPLLMVFYLVQDITPLVFLFGTVTLAYILRTTVSWEFTLLAVVPIAVVGILLFQFTAGEVVEQFVEMYLEFLKDLQKQAANGSAVVIPSAAAARQALFGYMAMGFAISMLAFLTLARWWQSVLYNPGGFQKEFHGLRLSTAVSTGLVVAMLVCVGIDGMQRWMYVLMVPLMMVGLGFVHWFIAQRQLSVGWLVSFYFIAILLQLFPALAFIALMDSWFDLRNRFRSNEV